MNVAPGRGATRTARRYRLSDNLDTNAGLVNGHRSAQVWAASGAAVPGNQ
jgi:hypothetical protein